MNNTSLDKITGIVHDLKHFDAELNAMQSWNDEMGEIMRFQYQHTKSELIKDLIIELLRSGIPFNKIDAFVFRLTTYLSKQEKKSEPLPQILKSSMQEVDRLVAMA